MTTSINKNTETKKEILDLKKDSKKEFALKTLLSLSLIVIGVALIVFFSMLDMGVGLILLGALATAYNIYQVRHSITLFNHAANSLPTT